MIRNLIVPAVLVACLGIFGGCDATEPFAPTTGERAGLVVDQTTSPLRLVPICAGVWRVDNLSQEQRDFTWDLYGTNVAGSGSVDKGASVYFRGGNNTTRLFVGGQLVNTKAANSGACGYSLGGTLFNDLDADGIQGQQEIPLAGITVNLLDPNEYLLASAVTDDVGSYSFAGLKLLYDEAYTLDIPAGASTANAALIPYYVPTIPSTLPYSFTIAFPSGLSTIGDVVDSFGQESIDIGLILDPVLLREAFDVGDLPRDLRDDHFWWQQMKRALAGKGAQRNAAVKAEELKQLLRWIEVGDENRGINAFYSEPFQFGSNPIAAAERILRPPANRNAQQSSFLSALLTVWLNRVYETNINTSLLDGLLLGAENAYQLEFGVQIVRPQMTVEGRTVVGTFSATSSLSEFEKTLTSTYRSGTGGPGSN
jgi:hypothetical protein